MDRVIIIFPIHTTGTQQLEVHTFDVHHEHLPSLLDPLLQQRASLILWDVHVVEELQEARVHLLLVQAVDQVGRFAAVLSGRNGAPHSACIVVVVAAGFHVFHFGTAEEGVQQASLAHFLVARHVSVR